MLGDEIFCGKAKAQVRKFYKKLIFAFYVIMYNICTEKKDYTDIVRTQILLIVT